MRTSRGVTHTQNGGSECIFAEELIIPISFLPI